MPVSRVFVSIFAIIHLSMGNMSLCRILAFPDQERSYPNQQSTYTITSLIGQLAIANQEESEMNSQLLKVLKNEYHHTDPLHFVIVIDCRRHPRSRESDHSPLNAKRAANACLHQQLSLSSIFYSEALFFFCSSLIR